MILTRADLRELTGRKARRLICAELQAIGVHFQVGLDGWPRVLRSHAEQVLSGSKPASRRKTEPNFEALHGKETAA